MQDKIITRAKKVLDGLRKHYDIRTYGELAVFLGVKQNTLSSWMNRDSLDEDLIYRKCAGVRYEYLKTGEGEMFQEKFKQFSETRGGDISNDLGPSWTHTEATTKKEEPPIPPEVAHIAEEFMSLEPATRIMLKDLIDDMKGMGKDESRQYIANLLADRRATAEKKKGEP